MIERIRKASWRQRIAWVVGALVAFLVLIQLVPYGRDHANPPVTAAAKFPDARSAEIFRTSCGDCHSNLTEWPWYSSIAPMSWLVQNHVDEGRSKMNLSEWNEPQPPTDEVEEQVVSGEMPPWNYALIHSGAKLTDAEKAKLLAAFAEIYRKDPPKLKAGG